MVVAAVVVIAVVVMIAVAVAVAVEEAAVAMGDLEMCSQDTQQRSKLLVMVELARSSLSYRFRGC